MAAKRKQRPPNEDLEAAVADIINNPITKVNLGFLQLSAEEVEESQVAPGSEPSPRSVESKPIGLVPKPQAETGIDGEPPPASPHIPLWVQEATSQTQAPAGRPTDPSKGVVATPMGDDVKPVAFRPEYGGVGVKPSGEVVPVSVPASSQAMFLAEQIGALFPASRVRRIRLAQDALSHVEEKVYDLLWGVKNQSKDAFRFADFSLQRIANEARINIKTVRELLPRLIDKGFIAVEREADVRRNLPTRYRVWSYSEILAQQQKRNRLWVVKTGKGVFYARPVSVGLTANTSLVEDAKLDVLDEPMGVGSSPKGFEIKPSGETSEPLGVDQDSEAGLFGALARMIRVNLGADADQALLAAMVHDCRARARATTGSTASDDEILHFCRVKTGIFARASNLRNPLGVLRIALPECFSGQPFLDYRAAEAERRQREQDEVRRYEELAAAQVGQDQSYERLRALRERVSERHRTEFGYDLKAIAEDVELDNQGREVARERMKRLGRYASHGL